MTPAELDKLDRLCAEKVMGWASRFGIWYNAEGKPEDYVQNWSPIRNIQDAWRLNCPLGLTPFQERPKPY